ncbi:hypothetical protein [Alysiella filiformis]|uniref:hypothetical protein n=1 Tax=Alysiella filiformis TaxID=194196 RepID=UPI00117786EF|nr:hypothetical protein [Alysiella filiformis]QMT30351.1 hypothetical protein H3L97_06165 [Alysiella filiformis]UBQ56672.1 hypothetical protein JF568_02525 [Alysiella filiformis DSM 16848]
MRLFGILCDLFLILRAFVGLFGEMQWENVMCCNFVNLWENAFWLANIDWVKKILLDKKISNHAASTPCQQLKIYCSK